MKFGLGLTLFIASILILSSLLLNSWTRWNLSNELTALGNMSFVTILYVSHMSVETTLTLSLSSRGIRER